MLRLCVFFAFILTVSAEIKLPNESENAAWEKIKARFNGEVEVKKDRSGKLQSISVRGFKRDKPNKGWARVSLNKEGRVFEVSSDRAGFTNEEFKLFAAFTQLQKLTLWHNASFHDKKAPKENYGGRGLAHLKELPHLTHVTLAGGGIDDEGLKAANELPHLKYIGMWHVPASDLGFSYFKGNETIEELKLGPFWEKLLTDKTLEYLAECPNFQKLRFGESYLTYQGLQKLVKIKDKLKVLDLHNSILEPEDVEKIKKDLPNTEVKWEGLKSAGKILMQSNWHLGKAKKWMPQDLIDRALQEAGSESSK